MLAEDSDTELVALEPPAGRVPVALRREAGRVVYGEMDQPLPRPIEFERTDELVVALGIDPPAQAPAAYTNGPTFVYVEVETEERLSALRPDMNALLDLGRLGVSCYAGAPPRMRVRMFGPGLGVPEDPATGSAAGPLGVHLVRSGRLAPGQTVELHQGVEIGRPSVLHVRIEASGDEMTRVVVGGAAVIVARGSYRVG